MINRREFIKKVGVGLSVGGLLPKSARAKPEPFQPEHSPAGALSPAALEAPPGKLPLIRKSWRPPNYETPAKYFDEIFTPNEAFFVRYHLSRIPDISVDDWRLKIDGDALARPAALSLAELKRNFEHRELVAVNQCSGNGRRLAEPRAPGVQWGYGAMGNARWRGVRLRDVLDYCGLAGNAVEIAANGADAGADPHTPDFAKSLPLVKALDDNTLIAFAMNGKPLPRWHGYPARLVVPGWTATYWVKHLTSLDVRAKPFDGFWMTKAYRVPAAVFAEAAPFPSQQTERDAPVTDIRVNSLITGLDNGQTLPCGQAIEIRGLAWDGGSGIGRVEVSTDNAQNWHIALLGADYGRFSWRQWRFRVKPIRKGAMTIMARAVSRSGEVQPDGYIENPAGYYHNAIQKLTVQIV